MSTQTKRQQELEERRIQQEEEQFEKEKELNPQKESQRTNVNGQEDKQEPTQASPLSNNTQNDNLNDKNDEYRIGDTEKRKADQLEEANQQPEPGSEVDGEGEDEGQEENPDKKRKKKKKKNLGGSESGDDDSNPKNNEPGINSPSFYGEAKNIKGNHEKETKDLEENLELLQSAQLSAIGKTLSTNEQKNLHNQITEEYRDAVNSVNSPNPTRPSPQNNNNKRINGKNDQTDAKKDLAATIQRRNLILLRNKIDKNLEKTNTQVDPKLLENLNPEQEGQLKTLMGKATSSIKNNNLNQVFDIADKIAEFVTDLSNAPKPTPENKNKLSDEEIAKREDEKIALQTLNNTFFIDGLVAGMLQQIEITQEIEQEKENQQQQESTAEAEEHEAQMDGATTESFSSSTEARPDTEAKGEEVDKDLEEEIKDITKGSKFKEAFEEEAGDHASSTPTPSL